MDQVSLYTFSPLKTLPACFTMLPTHDADGIARRIRVALLCLTGALGTYFRRGLKKRGLLWIFFFAATLLIVGAISILAPMVNRRFGVQGYFDSERWQASVSTIEIIRDYPSLGSGLGTFRFGSFRNTAAATFRHTEFGSWKRPPKWASPSQ